MLLSQLSLDPNLDNHRIKPLVTGCCRQDADTLSYRQGLRDTAFNINQLPEIELYHFQCQTQHKQRRGNQEESRKKKSVFYVSQRKMAFSEKNLFITWMEIIKMYCMFV